MVLGGDAVDHRLDGGIEQFDDEDQQQAADQQRPLDAVVAEIQAQRQQHRHQQQFLAERRLVAPGIPQAVAGIKRGVPDAPEAAAALVRRR